MKGREQLWTGLICLALAAAVLAVFSGAFQCDFVNYDDPSYVTSNAEVKQGLTGPGAAWAMTTGAASNWHPLTWISHMADVSLYGLDPRGHHLTSVLLHAVNAVLLFLLLRELTGATGRSAAVAALFALHPLRVESVVWISERKDVLSTLFWILAVWTYARYVRQRRPFHYALSLIFFVLGLMSKPMVVTLPFVLLLMDYWPLRRKEPAARLLWEKAPYFALSAVSCVITVVVQHRGGAISQMAALSLGARVANLFVSYARYLQKMFWPVNLSILYPHLRQWPVWAVTVAIVVLTLITAGVVWRRRAQPYLLAGWLWFLGMLIPVIGLVQVGIQSMADRYTYLPSVGVWIMVVWGAHEALARLRDGRVILGGATAVALTICALLTVKQTSYWRDSQALFQHAVDVTENNYLAYNNIGYYLSNKGKGAEAMPFYKRSLEINPNYEDAHNNLGFVLAGMGSNNEAIAEYLSALSLNSNLTEAHNNLGNALNAVGQSDAAISEFRTALEEDPHHAQAHNNLGVTLATHGRLDEAIEQFQMAIRARPDYTSAHSDLGNAYALQGKFDEAIAQYRYCLKLDPHDAQLRNNLGNALSQQGHLDDAVEQYKASIQISPDNPGTRLNYAQVLLRLGRKDEAVAQLEEAVRLKPGDAALQQQLVRLRGH